MKRLRLWFWTWAHDRAERLWHWIYYRRLLPLKGEPKPLVQTDYRYTFTYGKRAAIAVDLPEIVCDWHRVLDTHPEMRDDQCKS